MSKTAKVKDLHPMWGKPSPKPSFLPMNSPRH